jgi:hypothetical protein
MEFEMPLYQGGMPSGLPVPNQIRASCSKKPGHSGRFKCASAKFANAWKAMFASWFAALRWLARQNLCAPHARKLRREATGLIGLRPKDSVALGGDVDALAGVRGSGVVNQTTADHMKNCEPENKGGD